MTPELEIFDSHKNPIKVGSKVCISGYPKDIGRVTEVSDWDGDIDDYGKPIGIPPRISVMFNDGTDDDFTTSPSYEGIRICEDIDVIG